MIKNLDRFLAPGLLLGKSQHSLRICNLESVFFCLVSLKQNTICFSLAQEHHSCFTFNAFNKKPQQQYIGVTDLFFKRN